VHDIRKTECEGVDAQDLRPVLAILMRMNTQAPTYLKPTLTQADVEHYDREGYFIMRDPLFAPESFAKLKDHFERKLDRLPSTIRPEAMDVPHFTDAALFEWLFADAVLDVVEQLIGPDIALWSSHFICKPKGDGKRVPWHEDSAYWKGKLTPMQVVTVWLAIDPSTPENGCMYVVPRTHNHGFSDYDPVDTTKNVFPTEITPSQRNDKLAVPCTLPAGFASLHDGRIIHGSPANNSDKRRCGYTMRFIPTTVKFDEVNNGAYHQIYLARGRDHAGNVYADPTRSYDHLAQYREQSGKKFH
jgi:hypothetical protein